MLPTKSLRRYEPRVFGFKVHAAAALARWQAEQREAMKERLKAARVEVAFEEEEEEEEEEPDSEEDEEMDVVEQGALVAAQ